MPSGRTSEKILEISNEGTSSPLLIFCFAIAIDPLISFAIKKIGTKISIARIIGSLAFIIRAKIKTETTSILLTADQIKGGILLSSA